MTELLCSHCKTRLKPKNDFAAKRLTGGPCRACGRGQLLDVTFAVEYQLICKTCNYAERSLLLARIGLACPRCDTDLLSNAKAVHVLGTPAIGYASENGPRPQIARKRSSG